MANFVVPRAIARWYYLGLELFDPQDEATLNSMKKENKTSQEQCTEVLNHWLVTKKNATWNKLIKSLKSKSVNLPNLARDIEKMLDTRVSCYMTTAMTTAMPACYIRSLLIYI